VSTAIRHSFRHKAVFYEGIDGFMASMLPFVRDGVAAREPVMVAVDEEKIALLRQGLGEDAAGVRFVEMRGLGKNPGCIIPAWREFVAENAGDGRRARGIGEPIWAGRTPVEISECHQHEALLNVAFDDGPAWSLVCPYDAAALPAEVVEAARRTHPIVGEHGVTRRSVEYSDPRIDPLGGELAPPPARREEMSFTLDDLGTLRNLVQAWAQVAGLSRERAADLVLAVNELASNSIRHGGGTGTARSWREPGAFVCEIRDRGRIHDPLAGRGVPDHARMGGRGLWLVNQLCDLVQLRSLRDGCAVRLHMALDPDRAAALSGSYS
jgi:anti-sigma regulatory factor (Ser/Thr protein kinase)